MRRAAVCTKADLLRLLILALWMVSGVDNCHYSHRPISVMVILSTVYFPNILCKHNEKAVAVANNCRTYDYFNCTLVSWSELAMYQMAMQK